MEMKCYKVTCKDDFGECHEIKLMTSDENAAKRCAENNMREFKRIRVKATSVEEIDSI